MMEFRDRDYRAEEELAAASLPRSSAHHHPFAPPPPPPWETAAATTNTATSQVDVTDSGKLAFYDPLRSYNMNQATPVIDAEHVPRTFVGSSCYETSKEVNMEWTIFKRSVFQKFSSKNAISVSSTSDILERSRKDTDKSLMETHQEELDESHKTFKVEQTITRQEYISRIHEVKAEIVQAWRADDRVTALKLSIKVTRLLMDTTSIHFYPALFILVTEVLDMLGELVWARITTKAECEDDDGSVCSLAEDFISSDVCADAKETCNNWFCKIGSIRELLPRLYLELSILRCWRFLQDHPLHNLQRLTMMLRGIADPVAFAYCHIYMAQRVESICRRDTAKDIRYLYTSISDICILLRRIIMGEDNFHKFSNEKRKLLLATLEPAIEWIMKCIIVMEDQKNDILVHFGLARHLSLPTGNIPLLSVVLHYLLKELPADTIGANALEILKNFELYHDISFDEHLNYRLLGLKISEIQLPKGSVDSILNTVLQVVSTYNELNKYLMVVDAFMDIILQFQTDHYLCLTLEGILERSLSRRLTENELDILQSVLVKIINNSKNLEEAFSLAHFLELIDLLYGDTRDLVNMHLLSKVSRAEFIRDPTVIQLLFEVCKALHDRIDHFNEKHDYRQRTTLISKFVQMVDFGAEMDRHLMFLVQCRSTFGSCNEIKEIFVHTSNFLAIKALKGGKKHLGLVKACIAFNEVTIPSISTNVVCINLYIETAEVALLAGLVSHANGIIGMIVSSFENIEPTLGSRTPSDSQAILSSICKLCSFLIIIPGCHEEGLAYIPTMLMSIFQSQSWIQSNTKIKIFCSLISLSASLSQNTLPYYVKNKEVVGNDMLFFGETAYKEDLVSLSNLAVENIISIIEREPPSAAQGKTALDACNCLITSFKANHETSLICSRLIEIAKASTHPTDKYLISTMNYLKNCMSALL